MLALNRHHLRKFGNMSWFYIAAVFSYGAFNPERTNPIEVMPVYRQRYYAIIAKFHVGYGDHKDFEFFTKDSIRYYQQHPGERRKQGVCFTQARWTVTTATDVQCLGG